LGNQGVWGGRSMGPIHKSGSGGMRLKWESRRGGKRAVRWDGGIWVWGAATKDVQGRW